MTRHITVRAYVDIDLRDIDIDHLVEELEERRKKSVETLQAQTAIGANEISNLIERHYREVCRQITHGRPVAQSEREFWYQVHRRDI